MFALFPVPGDDFPGDNAVTASAASGCGSLFADFSSLEYRLSSVDFADLTPTERGQAEVDDLNTSSARDRAPPHRPGRAGPVRGTLAGAAR